MALEVRKDEDRSRYELVDGDEVVGVADYRIDGDVIVFPHTEISPERRGHGLGDVLVAGALDDVRGTGRRVVARCWFVAEFLDRHPDYAGLADAHQ